MASKRVVVIGAGVAGLAAAVTLAARGLEGAMLVTDAMPPVGGERAGFTLMGQAITVADGICRGPDGTLAGSALTMVQALRNAMDMLGLSLVHTNRTIKALQRQGLVFWRQNSINVPDLAATAAFAHWDEAPARARPYL